MGLSDRFPPYLHIPMTYPKKAADDHRPPGVRFTAAPDRSKHPLLRRLYTLLDRHVDDATINVDWLAMQLGINRKTLYRQVLRLTTHSPTDLIRQHRLQQAVALLRAGYSVTETAEAVGFRTASHFATVFKKQYGQTPTEFVNTPPLPPSPALQGRGTALQ